MAEIAVIDVLIQLSPLLLEELQLLSGVRQKLDEIKDDLESMRAFLIEADRRQDTDEGVKVWVKQVRKIAYDTEDVVDKFLFRMGRTKAHPKIFRCVSELKARRCISVKLQDIKLRLDAISSRKQSLSFIPKSVDMNSICLHLQKTAPFAKDSQLVGIQKPRDELVQSLSQDKSPLHQVVSVVGMGGLGKTTLVWKVYEDRRLEERFDCFAWITVSHSFTIEDLLRGLIKDFLKIRESVPKEISKMTFEELVRKLRNCLKDKRYFAVLDDIWTIDAWKLIECALPDNEKGSRIIITTRNADVAKYCSNSPENVYNMQPLAEKEAWTLFCKGAFGSDDSDGSCPPGLEQTSLSILRTCGGLPLAIVTIGRLLSTKKKTLAEWDFVHRSLGSELEHDDKLNSLNRILGLSYDDLPYHVKSCFLYFGVFPEDYVVSRAKLIRQWIAEGFIRPPAVTSLMTSDEISEANLDELVRRNLVQVVSKDSYGRVERCKVHDLMYRLILSKSQEQNFIILAHENIQIHDQVRRLSVHKGHSYPDNRRFPRLRSLVVFGPRENLRLSRFKMLKVLNLIGVPSVEIPSELFDLFNLRYLNLRRTRIEVVPESIRKLQNLQTLDIKYTDVRELPTGILNLQHIVHILALRNQDGDGVRMPSRIGSSTSLQKLCCLDLEGEDQVRDLQKLTQVRTLSISGVDRQDMKSLSDSIGKMCRLQSLFIRTKNESEPEDVQTLLTSPFLRCFKFHGRIKKLPDMLRSLDNLVKIKLVHCWMIDDPFKMLQFLPSLVDLRLRATYIGEQVSCDSGGFQKLKILVIREFPTLQLVNIEIGAVPNLESLTIRDCVCLESVPNGIEHLDSLKELDLVNMSDNFLERVREGGCDRNRVQKIPVIRKWHGDDSEWHHEDIETPVFPGTLGFRSAVILSHRRPKSFRTSSHASQ